MANEQFFMLGCEVGTAGGVDAERPMAIGKFTNDLIQVRLTKPGKFGTLADILKEYGVDTAGFPDYIKRALQLETTIQKFEYESKRVATVTEPNLTAFTPTPAGGTLDTELTTASVIKTGPADDAPLSVVQKADNTKKLTNYSATRTTTKGEFAVGRATFTFVIVARYDTALPIVPGVLAIKFLAFAISNDPKLKGALEAEATPAFEKAVQNPLLAPGQSKALTQA